MKKRILNTVLPSILLIGAVFIIGSGCTGSGDQYYSWYADADGDGFGKWEANPESATLQPQPQGKVRDASDCNDTDATINPDAIEVPDNDIDEDCNGLYAYTFYLDNDSDGFGESTPTILEINLGDGPPEKYVMNNVDCNDNDMTVNILADEIMGNGMDDNCNGLTDADDIRFIDEDGDGYGSQNEAAADGVFNNLDCDDLNPDVHPYATEVSGNNIDDDCDGTIDE
ncbi:MAG: hypothetical protein COA67_03215 [Lutibacter sp.]|nr:MAG: hypothetical protein COA67_03215 [Lutibacter sp.]